MYNAFYTQKIMQMSPYVIFYIALLLYSVPVIPFPRLPPLLRVSVLLFLFASSASRRWSLFLHCMHAYSMRNQRGGSRTRHPAPP